MTEMWTRPPSRSFDRLTLNLVEQLEDACAKFRAATGQPFTTQLAVMEDRLAKIEVVLDAIRIMCADIARKLDA